MDAHDVAAELRRLVERARYYGEAVKAEDLEELAGELKDHDDCYSADQLTDMVAEELDDRVRDATLALERERDELKARVEELEALGRRARGRQTLGELRACSRRLSAQIEALEAESDRVAYQLNRTERYTPEWDALEPRYDRLTAQRAKLQDWQRAVEARIGSRRRSA